MDWINLVQNREKWWGRVYKVMNFLAAYNSGYFLTS
jgi:hypothetical protein